MRKTNQIYVYPHNALYRSLQFSCEIKLDDSITSATINWGLPLYSGSASYFDSIVIPTELAYNAYTTVSGSIELSSLNLDDGQVYDLQRQITYSGMSGSCYIRNENLAAEPDGNIYVNYEGAAGNYGVKFHDGTSPTDKVLNWYQDNNNFYFNDRLQVGGDIYADEAVIVNHARASNAYIKFYKPVSGYAQLAYYGGSDYFLFTSPLSMNNEKITTLATCTASGEAANKDYCDSLSYSLDDVCETGATTDVAMSVTASGSFFTGIGLYGNLDLVNNQIVNVTDPTNDQDAATKKYVDDNVGGSTHDMLSATHTDSTASAVTKGSIIIGDATPKWAELDVGTDGHVLTSQADGTVAWEEASGGGASAIDDLSDVDTTTDSPETNEVLKFNGSTWVPAAYDATFYFSIASFTDNEASTQLIGDGVWESSGNITFDQTYTNGPPTAAEIILSSNGGVSWASNLTVTTPFLTVDSAEDTDYPSAKDKYITFTLDADKTAENDTSACTVYFRNYIYWGESTTGSSFSEAHVEALSGNAISSDQTRSVSIDAGASEYLVFAFPSSYTNLHDDGFRFDSITCEFNAYETVEITNSAGYTEDYKVYASALTNLGNHTLITSTSATLIDPLYYGKTSKTDTYLEADVEGLATSEITNDNTQVWDAVTTGEGEYMLFAFPLRLGTPSFWVGGFEGGFEDSETVSVTNVNGYTEDYYVWRSTNSNLGETEVETK